jgi:hypothetical protein
MPQDKVVEVDVMSLWAWSVIMMRNIVGETWGDEPGTGGYGLTVVVMVDCFVDCCDRLFGVVGISSYVAGTQL